MEFRVQQTMNSDQPVKCMCMQPAQNNDDVVIAGVSSSIIGKIYYMY